MNAQGKTRRSFLLASATGMPAAWIAANYPGILSAQEHARTATKFTFFTDAQAIEIEAMAAQIIPTDDTPGAREAHCIYFIDRALSGFAKDNQAAYIKGLADLQAKTSDLYADGGKFSALTSEQQIKVLTAMEKTPFFRTVRTHTVLGFFSRPVHGGNYDKAGWKLIGYDDSLNFKPPFGYYDALPQPKSRV